MQRRVIVDIKGVAKHYGTAETRVDALRNLDLTVHEGEVVALLGPSGSGKTTLLNISAVSLIPPKASFGWMESWSITTSGCAAVCGDCGWTRSAFSFRPTTCCPF